MSLRGAGAILRSSLVYRGWKSAEIRLVETDERLWFDAEVNASFT
jgi:hypothetical protein